LAERLLVVAQLQLDGDDLVPSERDDICDPSVEGDLEERLVPLAYKECAHGRREFAFQGRDHTSYRVARGMKMSWSRPEQVASGRLRWGEN
jgi:hypothetical protein